MASIKSLAEFRLEGKEEFIIAGGGNSNGTTTQHNRPTGLAAEAFNVLNDTSGDWNDEGACK